MENVNVKIRKIHKTDWKTFFQIYPIIKNLKNSYIFRWSLLLNFFIIFLCFFSDNLYLLLDKIISLNISIIPNILGFALGGYALLISGFSDTIIKKLVRIDIINYNTFQKTSVTFGATLLYMTLGLMINYITKYIIELNIFSEIKVSYLISKIINITILFFINIISIYSIMLTISIIKNIFAFSQFISAINSKEKLDDQEKQKAK